MLLQRIVLKSLITTAILIGVGIGVLHQQSNTTVFSSEEERLAIVRDLYHGSKTPQLIVVKADWCSACRSLEGRLLQLKLPYVEADIDKSAAARKLQKRLSDLGEVTIPQLIYKRKRVLTSEIGSVLQKLASETR